MMVMKGKSLAKLLSQRKLMKSDTKPCWPRRKGSLIFLFFGGLLLGGKDMLGVLLVGLLPILSSGRGLGGGI